MPPLQPPPQPSGGGELVIPSSIPETASVATSAGMSSSQLSAVLSTQRTTNKQCHTSRYFGYITWTTVESRDKDNKTNPAPHKKGLVIFRLPFTAIQLDLHYTCGMGTPSYALNVTHVIENTTELGKQLDDLMISKGDPKELHRLISERQLSLYSLFSIYNREMNLFFVRVMENRGFTWRMLTECRWQWPVDGLKDASTYFGTTSATIFFMSTSFAFLSTHQQGF